jgi:hypothetical protein
MITGYYLAYFKGLVRIVFNLKPLHFALIHKARYCLIPWTGGAFSPLDPFLCPTNEEKKGPIAPKPGP